MAAAALAARKWKTNQTAKSSQTLFQHNFTALAESADFAESLVKNQLLKAASQIQSLAEKKQDEFATLPQSMCEKSERKAAEDLFLQERLFKMSDPITDATHFASAWMPVKATLGRTNIFFTTTIKDGTQDDEILIENMPLPLIDWIQCGSLTKISDTPLVWKVVAEPGPKDTGRVKKVLSQGIKRAENKGGTDSGHKFLRLKLVLSRMFGSTAIQKKIAMVHGIAVQPPPNYQGAHALQTLETSCGQYLRLSVNCSGSCHLFSLEFVHADRNLPPQTFHVLICSQKATRCAFLPKKMIRRKVNGDITDGLNG
jgi:hypothetical protein